MAKKNRKHRAKAKQTQGIMDSLDTSRSQKADAPDTKMPRRSRPSRLVPSTEEQKPVESGIRVYNVVVSNEEMQKRGFDPSITTETMEELYQKWMNTAKVMLNKVSKQDYLSGAQVANVGAFTYSALLTQVSKYPLPSRPASSAKPPSALLSQIFDPSMPYGKLIGENVAEDGYETLHTLAVSVEETWASLSAYMTIYDFSTQKPIRDPKGSVFLAVNPEYTVVAANDDDLMGHNLQHKAKERVFNMISQIFTWGPAEAHWSPDRVEESYIPGLECARIIYTDELVDQVRSLPHILDLEERMKLLEPYPALANRPYTQTAFDGVMTLLRNINERRTQTRILHFAGIPMLDKRLVAIILRSCPKVTMLGIYDCPLIHFGDVLTFLDLIHEINQERVVAGKALIDKFDFFPYFNAGMPFACRLTQVFGLSWNEIDAQISQRGSFKIILEAFLKAKQMGIGLLFDEKHAFRRYLSQLPFAPLAVEKFLDAVHRYCAAVQSKTKKNATVMEAMYDLLIPVRQGIKDISNESHIWYSQTMGQYLIFCSSCGNKMLDDFFHDTQYGAREDARVCAGCGLRQCLDGQNDHQKRSQREAIDKLFPGWVSAKFNPDAPLHSSGEGLMNLWTTCDVRPPTPVPHALPNGVVYQPAAIGPLVRDNKRYADSTQDLPSLSELLDDKDIHIYVMFRCMMIDLDRVTANLLTENYPKQKGNLVPFAATRQDGGRPHSEFEIQRHVVKKVFFSWETVFNREMGVEPADEFW